MNKTVHWLDFAEEDLVWAKGVRVFKIHDLVALNQECVKQDGDFKKLEEACNLISPYYLSTRYPDVAQFEEYSEKQAQEVIEQADKIVRFIKSKIG